MLYMQQHYILFCYNIYMYFNHCCDITLLFKVLILFKEFTVSLVH